MIRHIWYWNQLNDPELKVLESKLYRYQLDYCKKDPKRRRFVTLARVESFLDSAALSFMIFGLMYNRQTMNETAVNLGEGEWECKRDLCFRSSWINITGGDGRTLFFGFGTFTQFILRQYKSTVHESTYI